MDSVLVIDDERQIRKLLEITLTANGYHVIEADTGNKGIKLAASHNPSIIILDLGLPDMEGIDVLRSLREWYHKPILILSVRKSEEDIVKALDFGANDYIPKPFRTGELLARLRVALRNTQPETDMSSLQFNNLTIDLSKHIVQKNNEIIKLTTTEFSLLALMTQNEGRVLTHTFILKEIWGYGYVDQTQYLRVFIAQLRKKIEDNPSQPSFIITESGIGYRFNGV